MTIDRKNFVLKELAKFISNKEELKDMYWILLFYGESKVKKNRIYKTAYFVKSPKINFNAITYNENLEFLKIDIEEKLTGIHMSGFIYDSNGINVYNIYKDYDKADDKAVYSYEFTINNKFDYRISTENLHQSIKSNFQTFPHYKFDFFKNADVIIPIHLILRYFFYESPNIVNILTENREKFNSIYRDGDVLHCSMKHSSINDAIFIGQYYFTQSEYGPKALKFLQYHWETIYNNIRTNKSDEFFIKSLIPFDKVKLKLKGIYLKGKDKDKPKFLALAITSCTIVGDEPDFIERLGIIKLKIDNDKRSLKLKEALSPKGYKDTVPNIEGTKLLEVHEDKPANSLNKPIIEIFDASESIGQILNFEKSIKELQKDSYFKNRQAVKDIDGITTNSNDKDSTSSSSVLMAVKVEAPISFEDVFFKAMELLKNNEYLVESIFLDAITEDGCSNFTYVHNSVSIVASMYIVQLRINNKNFILVEQGHNNYIGFFCKNDFSSFSTYKDKKLIAFINHCLSKGIDWSSAKSFHSISIDQEFQIKLYEPLVHKIAQRSFLIQSMLPINEVLLIMATNLYKRIESKIKSDL